jgi:uncharacterized protein (TIGR03086 family)
MTDIRNLNALAVRQSMDIVRTATPADLTRATPCAGWTLADLLGHMTVQHVGFAAAARGDGAALTHWKFQPAGDDAVERYLDASEDVLAAYAELPATLDSVFVLPEFGDPADPPSFPAAQAIGFHFIDYVVHGWDVARSLGHTFELADELQGPALAVTLRVPGGEARLKEGAAFAPALDSNANGDSDSEPILDRILRRLGRSPRWPEI